MTTPTPTPLPSTVTPVPVWHHPNFVSAEETRYGTRYTFKPFTGDEPKPELPDHLSRAFENACAAHEYGTPERRAASDAWSAAENEARAANTAWSVARFRRDVAAGLRDAVPAAQAYVRAKQAVEAAYSALDDAPDGKWRATMLRLVDARETVLKAAEQFDRAIAPVAERSEGHPERVLELLPSIEEIAREIGVDTTDWYIACSYEYAESGWGWSPAKAKLVDEFEKQDRRIKEVTRLVGDLE